MLSPSEETETFDMPLWSPWLTDLGCHTLLDVLSESYHARIAQAYELLRPVGEPFFFFLGTCLV